MDEQSLFEERQSNIIFSIYNKISNINSNKSLYKLLNKIAFYRYETAKLSKDENYEKFGKARFIGAEWGRCGTSLHNSWNKEFLDKMYYPYNHKLDSEFEVLITPIYNKYKIYENRIKNLCHGDKHLKDEYLFYDYKGFTNFIVKDILLKSDNGVFLNTNDNIPLTMFYYENDKVLLENIEKYGDKDFLSSNILIYKSIIHTPPELHEYILSNCVKEIIEFNNPINLNIKSKENNIASIFWFLSQATLYERGSASISEILCSAFLTILHGNLNYVIKLNGKNENILLDVEAMILSKTDFINYWNENIHKFTKKINKKTEIEIQQPIRQSIKEINKLEDKNNIDIINDLTLEFLI